MSTSSINCHSKKVRERYISHTALLVIIILLIIITIFYYYEKKRKKNIKWKMMKFKKVRIKNRMCHYFYNIIKLEGFDIDNILIDEKSHQKFMTFIFRFMTFHIKL